MITVKQFLCCLELKWGALIMGIWDIVFCCLGWGLGAFMGGGNTGAQIVYILCVIVFIAHLIGCILLIVSVFVNKDKLVILFLITTVCRFIIVLICLIYVIVAGLEGAIGIIVIYIIILIISVYFFICAYSWFQELGGSSPID